MANKTIRDKSLSQYDIEKLILTIRGKQPHAGTGTL